MIEFDDLPLLHEPDLMLAVLRVTAAKSGTLDDCIAHLRLLRKSAKIDEPLPEVTVRAGLQTALAKLLRARLVEASAPGRFRITGRGRQLLADNPDGVDDTILMQLPEFRAANGHARPGSPEGARGSSRQPPAVDYQAGYEAYLAGASLADNPQPPDVRACLDWENGWSQARDDDLNRGFIQEPRRDRSCATGARRESARASDRWR